MERMTALGVGNKTMPAAASAWLGLVVDLGSVSVGSEKEKY